MILVIDNYDSFTYNLVQYIGELMGGAESGENGPVSGPSGPVSGAESGQNGPMSGAESGQNGPGSGQNGPVSGPVSGLGGLRARLEVHRNDAITVEQVREMNPERIVISPGPCTPEQAGISLELIGALGPTIPMLGVCLGHQAIGQAFGGAVVRAPYLMHGKTSSIRHGSDPLFAGLPSPFTAMRYHSLIVRREDLPTCLEVTAETDDGLIMAMRHRSFPIVGVQFHPESIATEHGMRILANFLGVGIS